MQSGVGILSGAVFLILWLGMMAGMIVGWVVLLIALWRGMKAHESIADSLQQIAGT
jgi:hypothetical protein